MRILLSPLAAIRKNCLWCSCDSSLEVERCVIPDCPLFLYRFGRRPETARRRGKEIGEFERKVRGKGEIPVGLRKFVHKARGADGTQGMGKGEVGV